VRSPMAQLVQVFKFSGVHVTFVGAVRARKKSSRNPQLRAKQYYRSAQTAAGGKLTSTITALLGPWCHQGPAKRAPSSVSTEGFSVCWIWCGRLDGFVPQRSISKPAGQRA